MTEEKLKNVFDKFDHQGQFDSFYELASMQVNTNLNLFLQARSFISLNPIE